MCVGPLQDQVQVCWEIRWWKIVVNTEKEKADLEWEMGCVDFFFLVFNQNRNLSLTLTKCYRVLTTSSPMEICFFLHVGPCFVCSSHKDACSRANILACFTHSSTGGGCWLMFLDSSPHQWFLLLVILTSHLVVNAHCFGVLTVVSLLLMPSPAWQNLSTALYSCYSVSVQPWWFLLCSYAAVKVLLLYCPCIPKESPTVAVKCTAWHQVVE